MKKASLPRAAAFSAMLLLTLAGCLTTPVVVPTRYFTISPEVGLAPAESTGKTLGVRPLIGAKPYRVEIAYIDEPNQLAYFTAAEWAEAPATLVNRALLDGLKSLGMFRDVGDAANMARPDYVLTGELRRFEADYTASPAEAVVEVSVAVRESAGTEALWEGRVRAEAALRVGRDEPGAVQDVARAMSEAVSELVRQIGDGLRNVSRAPG